MRTINVVVEDEDFEKLMRAKGDRGWKDFIMPLANMIGAIIEIQAAEVLTLLKGGNAYKLRTDSYDAVLRRLLKMPSVK